MEFKVVLRLELCSRAFVVVPQAEWRAVHIVSAQRAVHSLLAG